MSWKDNSFLLLFCATQFWERLKGKSWKLVFVEQMDALRDIHIFKIKGDDDTVREHFVQTWKWFREKVSGKGIAMSENCLKKSRVYLVQFPKGPLNSVLMFLVLSTFHLTPLLSINYHTRKTTTTPKIITNSYVTLSPTNNKFHINILFQLKWNWYKTI